MKTPEARAIHAALAIVGELLTIAAFVNDQYAMAVINAMVCAYNLCASFDE